MFNSRRQPWNSYKQVATQTAPSGQLVLMLYEGGINFLTRALAGFEKEDPAESNEAINNNIIRAQQIVQELNASLDMQLGGELAMHLRRLYSYIDWRLDQSNIRKEPEGIRECIDRITVLRNAWAEMLEKRTAAPDISIRDCTAALA